MAQEKWLVSEAKTIDLDGVRSLKVALVGGQIDIVAHDEPGVRVEVHSVTGKELRITLDGDRLELDHPQLGWENFIEVFRTFSGKAKAEVSVLVPRGIALKFGVVSASALVSGLTTDPTLSTVSGDLVIDGVRGNITVNTVSGEVSLRNHEGSVDVHTVSADVTASGRISKFTSDSVSGDMFLDLVGTPDEIRSHSVSGDLTVRLEPGVPAQYRINTVSGVLQLDDAEIKGVRGSFTSRFGTLDQHWLELRANSVSGDVSVLHAVNA
ncbi:DUF4097 family beta strand repeat-containing protein [Ruicaihuangia caeni]|uniref:DUF4097 family beta strand repeat-containing protein n=1 Tax=Ruicaihuangia caeni TaxID=3042517 RepID=A0AAW6T9V6_9MICO|nr:DUF4097 family beta strand repeat-containing protein [Klugiella sp. YN-L-19]MDI2098412.1 DUF4097 family beta strand repeat-containing protein [Klugiella sp. YN-L-19]